MNEKIVFIRTSSGEDEARSRTAHLSKDIKRALLMVDGTATVAEISKRASPSLRSMLEDMFAELVRGGFIQDKTKSGRTSRLITPLPASPKKSAEEGDELDFTAAYRVPTPALLAEEAARLQMDDKVRPAEKTVQQEGMTGRIGQTVANERVKAALVSAQAEMGAVEEVRALAQREAEARALDEQHAARLKAEQKVAEEKRVEAERHARAAVEAARRAEQHAARVKAEAEAGARAVAEEKAQLSAEVARLKLQAEAEARVRVEERTRMEADEARRCELVERTRIEQDAAAAAAMLEAERHAQAARRAEQQAADVKAEAERRAHAVAEEKAALEAEVARLKMQAEAEAQARVIAEQQAKREAEAAEAERREIVLRAKAEQNAADAAARLEAEHRAMAAIEAARKAEQLAAEIKAEAERRARAVAEEKAVLEAEVARLMVQAEAETEARTLSEALARQEAEAARAKAELEAQRAREEAEQARLEKAQAEQKAERLRVEQEAAEAASRLEAERQASAVTEAVRKAEQHAAEIKAEAEARAHAVAQEKDELKAEVDRLKTQVEAEARARAEALAEAALVYAGQEAEQVRAEQEDGQGGAVHEAFNESDLGMLKSGDDLAVNPVSARERRVVSAAVAGCDSRGGNNGVPVVERKATTAAVLFFDIAGYARQTEDKKLELKQQFGRLLNDSLAELSANERIVLDTECGAAVGFLQHPTDALEVATHFRADRIAHKHYGDLRVCIGIHLGPVSLVKDMNGQINMLGDGINSAQCVMGFAGQNQIYVSRAYFDFLSSLNTDYDALFRYRGSQQNQHGREYQIYELLDDKADEVAQAQNQLADFNFDAFDMQSGSEQVNPPDQTEGFSSAAEQLLIDSVGLGQTEENKSAGRDSVASREVPQRIVAEMAYTEPVHIEQTETYSAEEAMQIADAQSIKWAVAARRAEELARKKSESTVFRQQVIAVAAVKPRRKPVPWGKLLAGLFVLLLLALAVLPVVLPMQGYLANIERLTASTLQQPVQIARLSGRILPTPRLVLNDVSVGEARQIQIRQVQVDFSFEALTAPVQAINSLTLDGVEVKGAALPQVSSWLQQVAANHQYPVARINLTQGKLAVDGVPLPDVSGELNFDSTGRFIQAHLNAIGHKLALDIRTAPENKLQMLLTLSDSALPIFSNWVFEDLNATGELTRDELRVTDFDGRIRGGVVTGNARINWRSGWRVQGALVGHVIPLQNISKLLDGDLNGTASFQMQAPSLDKLADAAVLNGVFSVKKGVISGVDIVETMRLHSQNSLPGGRTHFDDLSGDLSYSNGSYRFSQLNINNSVFQANGALTIAGPALSGHLLSELTMRDGVASDTLQVSGTSESPSLHVAY